MALSCRVARYCFLFSSARRSLPQVCFQNAAVKTCSRLLSTTYRLDSERRYTDKHEWVQKDGNVGTVGITSYAQDSLGEVVYAQLPDVGTEYKAMDECGALESVKAASELFCPVSGKVVDKNKAVEEKPGLINSSPFEEGWLFKLELSNPSELDAMMDEGAYNNYLKTQEH